MPSNKSQLYIALYSSGARRSEGRKFLRYHGALLAGTENDDRCVALLRRLPAVQDDPAWRCRSWIGHTLADMAADGRCVGRANLDSAAIETRARLYVTAKTAAGRYTAGSDMAKPKPTWDNLTNKVLRTRPQHSLADRYVYGVAGSRHVKQKVGLYKTPSTTQDKPGAPAAFSHFCTSARITTNSFTMASQSLVTGGLPANDFPQSALQALVSEFETTVGTSTERATVATTAQQMLDVIGVGQAGTSGLTPDDGAYHISAVIKSTAIRTPPDSPTMANLVVLLQEVVSAAEARTGLFAEALQREVSYSLTNFDDIYSLSDSDNAQDSDTPPPDLAKSFNKHVSLSAYYSRLQPAGLVEDILYLAFVLLIQGLEKASTVLHLGTRIASQYDACLKAGIAQYILNMGSDLAALFGQGGRPYRRSPVEPGRTPDEQTVITLGSDRFPTIPDIFSRERWLFWADELDAFARRKSDVVVSVSYDPEDLARKAADEMRRLAPVAEREDRVAA